MDNYVELATRTEAPYTELPTRIGSIQVCRILHASIGLCTEVGELVDAMDQPEFKDHAKEEIGDLWWYNAILHDAMLRKLYPSVLNLLGQCSPEQHLGAMVSSVGIIQDVIKRTLFYGKPLDWTRLEPTANLLTHHLVLFGHAVGVAAKDAMAANIAKLTARYPERFSEAYATNRNIEAERNALANQKSTARPI